MALILVVDDNDDNRLVYCTFLEHFGHTCIQAENGQTGLSLAQEAGPDLIILDIQMPVMDGFQTLEALRLRESTARIPVIALTAHTPAADEVRVREAGFAEYLRKPMPPREVATLVEAILARTQIGE